MTLAPRRGRIPLIPRLFTAVLLSLIATAARPGDLTAALGLAAQKDAEAAYALVSPESPVERDLVTWMLLANGEGGFETYLDFSTRHPDWPGMAQVRRMGEATIGPATPQTEVLAYFGSRHAQTPHGALYFANALTQAARDDQARAEIVLAWRQLSFSRSEQAIYMREFAPLLERHTRARLDWLLWRGLTGQAERLFPYLTEADRALARARIVLRKDGHGVDARIAAVPAALADDPGLAFERFLWRLDHGKNAAAEDLLRKRSASADTLGEPGFWAGPRRDLARDALREGRARDAYELASNHQLTAGADFADLEWLSGYIALTALDDPELALSHFRRFLAAVDTPISLGRGAYWEGRAYAALGRSDEAQVAMAYGGEFQSGFYGLLAAEAAGLPMDPDLSAKDALAGPEGDFLDRDVFLAGLALRGAGETRLAARFFLQLADEISDEDLSRLADLTLRLEEPYLAVVLAKQAAERGLVLNRPYFPLAELPGQSRVPPELTLSIIRRESEFFEGAVSRAGARGLMQLMPATAREVAGWLGEDHGSDRLTEEPDYNVLLGTTYLETLIERFGGNVMLVAAAYNAGPSRVESWIREFGDPRDPDRDAIDWIETIPFRETRNYVMRVAESVVIYRARLAGAPHEIRLAEELKE